MPKRSSPHRDLVLEHLQDPRSAASYLNAALDDSDEMFLVALRDVAEAYKMAKVAAGAGVSRESVYRMLSETGNPTYANLLGILRSLGLRLAVEADIAEKRSERRPDSALAGSSKEKSGEIRPQASRLAPSAKKKHVRARSGGA